MVQHKNNSHPSIWSKFKIKGRPRVTQTQSKKHILLALLKHNLITWHEVNTGVR